VSHNRWFVSRLCTRIIEVSFEGLREFPGGYDEFMQHYGVDHLDREAVARADKDSKAQARDARRQEEDADPNAPSWDEKKRLRNRKKQLPRLRAEVEDAIAAAEQRLKGIQADYASPGFFEGKTQAELTGLREEEQALTRRIEDLMRDWEALELESAQLADV